MLLEPKNHNQQIERVHRDSSSILLETFFEILCLVAHGCLVLSRTLIVII